MTTLRVSDAVELVRKNLDELDPNGSIMYVDENGSADEFGDNRSMDDLIARNLPESINAVHLIAPVWLLEGETAELASSIQLIDEETGLAVDTNNEPCYYDSDETSDMYGMLHLQLADSAQFLRLVSFQAVDSPIVITEVIAEASPEGRKQLNKYIRGQYDRPRLVQLQGQQTSPAFNYFSLRPDTMSKGISAPSCIKQFTYIKEQIFSGATKQYSISPRLRQNIIDCLTAMVLETYSDQRAQAFYQKAKNYVL